MIPKIKTQDDIDALDLRIKGELGIDVGKYRNQEAVDNLVDLLVFPRYALTWAIRPPIVFFILFIIGFFVIDLVHIEYLIYALVGLLLFMLAGFFAGLLYLVWKIKIDVQEIANYSLDVLKSSVTDLNQVTAITSHENRKEALGLLFNGITHIVTVPVLSTAITKKIPLIGWVFTGLLKRILGTMARAVEFDDNFKEGAIDVEIDESVMIERYVKSVSFAGSGINTTLLIALRIAQVPLALFLLLFLSLLGGFIYLIW
ncbi:hypothetical protein N8482_00525 [Chitinophagales bacterium]|nr:hypothetical protein [Chitinophagales bacterium]